MKSHHRLLTEHMLGQGYTAKAVDDYDGEAVTLDTTDAVLEWVQDTTYDWIRFEKDGCKSEAALLMHPGKNTCGHDESVADYSVDGIIDSFMERLFSQGG